MRLALAALLVAIALPAQAHTPDELDEWATDWNRRVAHTGFTVGLAIEHADMVERHLWYFHPQPVRAPTDAPSVASQPRAPSRAIDPGVEQWRGLVATYFPAGEVDRALCIMGYESGGNPNAKNPRSSARGLMQILASLWAPHFGVSYEALYDPETNMGIARAVWDQQYWWGWTPYRVRGLCR